MQRIYNDEYVKNEIERCFDFPVKKCEFLDSGYDCEAYLINYKWLFKITRYEEGINKFRKEKLVLDYLKDNFISKVKVPKVDFYDECEDYAIMGYEYIKGNFLTPKLYKKMNKKQKEQLIKDIVDFLKRLHDLPINNFESYVENDEDECKEDLKFLKKHLFKNLSEKEQKYIEELTLRVSKNDKFKKARKCLCHNDFSSKHIIINDRFVMTGVIDFGDSVVKEEYVDFVYLLEDSEEEIGKAFGKKVLKAYEYEDESLAIDYADLNDDYYIVECLIEGIKHEDKEIFDEGMKYLKEAVK